MPASKTKHELKCWVPYFYDILSGKKKFEIRPDDRNFKAGDLLLLREFDPNQPDPEKRYTGRSVTKKITYVMQGNRFGLERGYVALSLDDSDQ